MGNLLGRLKKTARVCIKPRLSASKADWNFPAALVTHPGPPTKKRLAIDRGADNELGATLNIHHLLNTNSPLFATERPGPSLARTQENRDILRRLMGSHREDGTAARGGRREALFRAIDAGMKGEHIHIDLSACSELSVHEMDPDVAQALVSVLGEPQARIIMPKRLRSLPAWIYQCGRVEMVEIPEFAADRLDLSWWKPQESCYATRIVVSATPGFHPRVLVPSHLIVVSGDGIEQVGRFATRQDIDAHEALLAACLDARLRADPRIDRVAAFVKDDLVKLMEDGMYPPVIELQELAVPLIINYYGNRFNTAIEAPRYPDGAVLQLDDQCAMEHLQLAIDAARSRNGGEEFRQAFVVRIDSVHWAPLIYLREPGADGVHEVLFYPDSRGDDFGFIAEQLAGHMTLPVLAIEEARQADGASCLTDALVFCRDITARSTDGNYQLPKLLGAIGANTEEAGPYRLVNFLPDTLLKTAQTQGFTRRFPAVNQTVVHIRKGETGESIESFRRRHVEEKVPVTNKGEKKLKDMAHYLRFKGFQFVRTLWVQHLHEELTRAFGDDYTAVAGEFIARAKPHIGYMHALRIDRVVSSDGS